MKYFKRFNEVQSLLTPVAINMTLTLIFWIGLYKMESRDIKWAQGAEFENWVDLGDGFKPEYVMALGVALLVCMIYAIVIFDFRKAAQLWVSVSALLPLYLISSMFFYDLIVGPNVVEYTWSQLALAYLITALYGTVGAVSYFTGCLPSWVHRAYIICNCSLVSQYYLFTVPAITLWGILVAMSAFGTFSVMSPIGLANIVIKKSGNYNGNVVRFLMYSASADSNNSDSEEDEEGRSALDVLNDGSRRLGLGDFIFFSVLVGLAATYGSILGTIGAFIGVLAGLTYAVVFQDGDTVPVLSFAVYFGVALFVAGYQIEPFIGHMFHRLYDQFALGF